MPRKITEESVHAFLNHFRFRKSNMEVETHFQYTGNPEKEWVNTIKMYLHGNCIAKKIVISRNLEEEIVSSKIYITDAGWRTTTTKERLNGIPWVSISQKKGVWYLNGKPLTSEYYEAQWYGSRLKWIDISNF